MLTNQWMGLQFLEDKLPRRAKVLSFGFLFLLGDFLQEIPVIGGLH